MQNTPALLEAHKINKIFPGVVALDKVDFILKAGEVHALLGENGAGKSTLIKCLTGAYKRDGGDILLNGQSISPRDTLDAQGLGIGTVYQEVNLLANLTVAENMLLGRQPKHWGIVQTKQMNQMTKDILNQYGLNIDVSQLLSAYSVAIQQIIAIARAVDLSGKVLILDEPTASLDAKEVQMLFGVIRKLKQKNIGIIFISHFLDQVFEISDSITVLRNGRLIETVATNEISSIDLVTMMLGYELGEEVKAKSDDDIERETLVEFKDFGRKQMIEAFDLKIGKGEVVGFAGLLGSGRTETAEILFGVTPHDSGSATLNGQDINLSSPRAAIANGFGFCPEDRKSDGIIADLSVRENIILALQAQRGWANPLPKTEQLEICKKYIKALDIRPPDPEKPIRLLSGGNQQKVILARWLATNPDFLILDEPTRGIDVGAHAEIIRLIENLCEDGMSLLVISSELDELVAYSHRIIVVRDHQHVAELIGSEISTDSIVETIAADLNLVDSDYTLKGVIS
ncbi:MAG: sugar ABC transporter ATP-binding protein [OCS116 cluster bacterium]|nr:sugar ABC transporter ATP-binding protein [OCS116 cluster bacterium]